MHVLVIERDNTDPTVFGPFHSEQEGKEFMNHMLRDWGVDEQRHVTGVSVRVVRSPS